MLFAFLAGAVAPISIHNLFEAALFLGVLLAYAFLGVFVLIFGAHLGQKNRSLMWQIRKEGFRRGVGPYPADAMPPRESPYRPDF